MVTTDPRVDAYLQRSAPFAQPILAELRARVHQACPAVEETIKWGMPAFAYHGPLADMAAFQKHCTFGFWKHDLVLGANPAAHEAMGSFGRLTCLRDLPNKRQFARFVKAAMRLNEQGVKAPRQKTRRAPVTLHPEFALALRDQPAARRTLDQFAPSHRREYLAWIADAKQPATRARRIAQALTWLAEGKHRNWKYEP